MFERSRRRAVTLLPANRAALKHFIAWPGSKKAGSVNKSHCAPRQFVQPAGPRATANAQNYSARGDATARAASLI
jgi:hypothetical protein